MAVAAWPVPDSYGCQQLAHDEAVTLRVTAEARWPGEARNGWCERSGRWRTVRIKLPPESDPHRTLPKRSLGPSLAWKGEG
jgi:hypothetical protein